MHLVFSVCCVYISPLEMVGYQTVSVPQLPTPWCLFHSKLKFSKPYRLRSAMVPPNLLFSSTVKVILRPMVTFSFPLRSKLSYDRRSPSLFLYGQSYLTTNGHLLFSSTVKVILRPTVTFSFPLRSKLSYDRWSVDQSVMVSGHHQGPRPIFLSS
jgi:hypothetical protein